MTAILRSLSIYPGWLWYDFGRRRAVTGVGDCPLLRSTVRDIGEVLFLPLDLVAAGANDREPPAQTRNGADARIPPEQYFASPPVEVSQPPADPPPVVVEPPVTPPPPVVIPPVVNPITKYKIKNVTHGAGLPLIVFFGVVSGLRGKLVAPSGIEVTFVTGGKPEFGAGGTEAGYATQTGDYSLIIDGDKFIIPMSGKFTKIEFESVTAVDDAPVVLRSGLLSRARAVELLAKLEDIFRGVFKIEV